jgi:hypothetical protein
MFLMEQENQAAFEFVKGDKMSIAMIIAGSWIAIGAIWVLKGSVIYFL